jgi:DNA-binding IclR family transcriptional regulator
MTASNIPADVRRFLLAAIASVPHLEALLLLRAEPAPAWNAKLLARRLYLTEDQAGDLLADLESGGLVRRDRDGGWRFAPRDAGVGATVDRLAAAYARHVVEIAELIHSTSDRKAQRFADAFRWRKE